MGQLLKGQRILVVEDNFVMALDLSQMVEELGGVVAGPAGRLEEGVALAKSNEIDGAILDVNLDGSDTFNLADGLFGWRCSRDICNRIRHVDAAWSICANP